MAGHLKAPGSSSPRPTQRPIRALAAAATSVVQQIAAVASGSMRFLHSGRNVKDLPKSGRKPVNVRSTVGIDAVQIHVQNKAQADTAWRLLVNQWEIDQAQVWIKRKPVFVFKRGSNGEPQLQRSQPARQSLTRWLVQAYRPPLKTIALLVLSFGLGVLAVEFYCSTSQAANRHATHQLEHQS